MKKLLAVNTTAAANNNHADDEVDVDEGEGWVSTFAFKTAAR